MKRIINMKDIQLPQGYRIEMVAMDLNTPISLAISDQNELFVGDAGILSGSGKLHKLTPTGPVLIAEGFNVPLTGVTFFDGSLYVSHRGVISRVGKDGSRIDILSGLPSLGDHQNNKVVFGSDRKMYFGQGTATNSGVVGEDNHWLKKYPFFHDYPGAYISLSGQNFQTKNNFVESKWEKVWTGPYSPFGVPVYQNEHVKGVVKASGSILRANLDGSQLELFAWGLRNPFGLKFDRYHRLFCSNHGIDVRGSRPVAESPDEFQWIRRGLWYGWPDYTGGEPVTNSQFKPEGMKQPQFILAMHPMIPPKPVATFKPHSAIMGFDFNHDPSFGPVDEVYIAEFGSEAPETTGGKKTPNAGHRVSRLNPSTGSVSTFIINKTGKPASETGGGGIERPIDIVFGKHHEMYIVDFGFRKPFGTGEGYLPETGVIWRVEKEK